MNFKSIDYFLAVAREQSITKAASLLHITQQTLSADIAALERELGHTLFLRRVPLQLTYAGEVFLRYAEGFQQSRRSMEREIGLLKGVSGGNVQEAAEKPSRVNYVRIALYAAALVLIVLGINNGGMRDVLIKAINICTECIGLG